MKPKQREHKFLRGLGRVIPYLAAAVVIFGCAAVGSKDKNSGGGTSLNMSAMAASDSVSADQLSELYVVASISSAMNLASTDAVSGNYVSASVLREISQTSADKIEKPGYVSVSVARGVDTYIVADGDSMERIARKYGVTTDQIRWSNGLKTAEVSMGQVLSIPTTAGIVYTVKAGDTVESLASRYGSSTEEIIARNDLEASELVVGGKILLPGGSLPEVERPEYVPPVRNHTYSYYGASSDRQGMRVVTDERPDSSGGNTMVRGQCTYYVWWWRHVHGMGLPGGTWGDAKHWVSSARARGLTVDKNPSYGAVFQTPAGWYGHVGIVLKVYDDGSLLVREMNYGYRSGVITESVIPANSVGNFNYIH